MKIHPVTPREASMVMRFDLPAERLRMKGQTVRVTHFGEVCDYVVTDVSYPDHLGNVNLRLAEPRGARRGAPSSPTGPDATLWRRPETASDLPVRPSASIGPDGTLTLRTDYESSALTD